MYAITGITGQVGGVVAQTLLAAKQSVRAVVRNEAKAESWWDLGCEVSVADIRDAEALTAAFQGAEGVFVMVPPNFDPLPGFPEAHATAQVLRTALEKARPGRVVYLSTIGAQAVQENLLSQHGIIEHALRGLAIPLTLLRPGWFMENSSWDVAAARMGVVPSFLQPLDKPVPMVATADIGRLAAELLMEPFRGQRVVELEGPQRLSPEEIAAMFARQLGHPVRTEAVPRETWEDLFTEQGMKHPTPRLRMLDGFNAGWIEFAAGPTGSRKGTTSFETVLESLLRA